MVDGRRSSADQPADGSLGARGADAGRFAGWGRLATYYRVPTKPRLSFVEAVKKVVRDLDRGEVASYGEVARRAGYPRAARAVGNVLASGHGLPWWRVIRANGDLAAGDEQARRLRREGVRIQDGRVTRRSRKPRQPGG
jgi:methylated-DNA-protein-cysteine methyltransferase related protein